MTNSKVKQFREELERFKKSWPILPVYALIELYERTFRLNGKKPITYKVERKDDKLKSQRSRRRTRTSQPAKGARAHRPKRATVLRG